jgi:CRISPR-associated protein Csa3
MRTYVSTLGFHETRVTRPVIKHGIDAGDRVVLVRPASEGRSDRAEDAIGYVEDMIGEVEPNASVTTEQIETNDFTTAILECSDLLNAVDRDRTLLVNFGGGAREVLLPLLLASVLHARVVDQAFQYTDVEQHVRSIEIPDLTAQVPTNAVDTFELITRLDSEVTLPTLADESDRSKSTVGRHVDALADTGVIETRMENNVKYVSVSQTGRLLTRARAREESPGA